jgi:hypothetical protein
MLDMKKIYVSLLILALSFSTCSVVAIPLNPEYQEIVFVYIHGAKNYSPQDQKNFEEQVDKLHGKLIKELYESDIVKKQIQKNRTLFVEKPEIFYWGNEVQEDIKKLEIEFEIFKNIYEKHSLSALVRKSLGFALHDMVWLAKSNGKQRIIEDLLKFLEVQKQKKRKVIFMAYSAGSIVLYDLMVFTMPYIDFHQVAADRKIILDSDEKPVNQIQKYTCIKALEKNKMTKFDEFGNIVASFDDIKFSDPSEESDFAELKQKYFLERLPQLRNFSEDYCLADNFVAGIVTFGSPITVSRSTGGSNLERAFKPLVKHFYEKDIFWLNINHSKDIFAYPIYSYNDDLIFEEIDTYDPKDHESEINPQGGVIVNNFSKVRGSSILGAHGWYLNKPESFAKLIVETYEQAYMKVYNR